MRMKTMGDRQDIYVLCPFYRRTEHHAIVCEGLSDESNIKQGFSTAESFRSYKKQYCDSERCYHIRKAEESYYTAEQQ